MQPQPNHINITVEEKRGPETSFEQETRAEQESASAEQESNFFTDTINLIKQYVSDRITLIKLQSIEKVSTLAASIASAVTLAVLGLFFLIFFSITLGFLFSYWLDSEIAGFGIVAGIYLILIIIIVVFGKKIFGNLITKKIIQNSFKKKDGKQ
ncbi:phage holin family protein [Ilyomonas limi]|uniref:Phage holin family protein n=1 Tax=Ilyomonas limi TaxID=2575867 RepID=A0A4U3KZH2_9BACT|nr:phage holin family protein [Ilyomonas limi]TKK68075.1 phage holin family protein [Ilyomonas limi]